MMLYAFVKDESGLVFRIGADCEVPPPLTEKLSGYMSDNARMDETGSLAGEWDQQMTNAAQAGMVPDPNAPVSGPVEGQGSTEEGSVENAQA
jgi:hypothetical protein